MGKFAWKAIHIGLPMQVTGGKRSVALGKEWLSDNSLEGFTSTFTTICLTASRLSLTERIKNNIT